MINTKEDVEPDWDLVTFACMTQLSMKAGLKKHRETGEAAASKELNQLHLREVFQPVDWVQLSKEERQSVMESHMFVKEKRDGTVKAETAAGGNKQ